MKIYAITSIYRKLTMTKIIAEVGVNHNGKVKTAIKLGSSKTSWSRFC